jgi:hypothetical protein
MFIMETGLLLGVAMHVTGDCLFFRPSMAGMQ